MKYSLKYVLLLILLYSTINAQNLYFCLSHTEGGEPIEAKITWEIKPWGKHIYVLFNNGDKLIKDPLIYLFVDKLQNNGYQPFDSKSIEVGPGKTWVAYDYEFSELGKYEVYYMNPDQVRLAAGRVTIKLEDEYEGSTKFVTSIYYDHCDMVFCDLVISGKPVNVKNRISLQDNQGQIYVYLKNNNPLNTEKFFIDIWRKKSSAFEFDEFIESKKFKLDPEWYDAFFKYKFSQPGEYKVSVYNDKEVLMQSNYITVVE